MFWNKYPWTDFHELNASWLLQQMQELKKIVETFIKEETITFADPIKWNITTQYSKNTVVLDENGNAFLSLQPVPKGIQLNNSDYWLKIFDFINYQEVFNKNLTFNVELNTTQASAVYSVGDWLLWNNVLYKVTQAIAVNDDFIINANIEHFTLEELIKEFTQYVIALIQQYKDDIDASELAFTNYLQNQFDQLVGSATVDSEVINARLDIEGVNNTTLRDAIIKQIALACDTFNNSLKNVTLTFENGYIDTSGNFVSNSGWRTTQFINAIDFVNISGTFTNLAIGKHIAWYDRYGGYLGGDMFGDSTIYSHTIAIPDQAAFVRVSTTNGNQNSIVVNIPKDNIKDAGFIRTDTVFSSGYIKPDGSIQASSGWKHTNLIPARKYVKYGGAASTISSDVGCNLAFYDQNGNFIRGAGFKMDLSIAEYVFPMQNDEYYVALSIPNGISDGYFAPYVSALEDTTYTRIKVVSNSGRGNFRSVSAAVKAAIDGDVIFVKKGTYTGEHIEAWGKTVSIIGEDKLNTIITCSDSTYANPLIEMSTGLLENLTLKTTGGTDGYTLHDEDTFSFGKNFTIKNCIIENEIGECAIGIGMNGNCSIEISECELRTNASGVVFYVHDANDSDYAGTFILDMYNNILINAGANIISFQSQSMPGSSVRCSFMNNTFYRSDTFIESDIVCKIKQPDNTYTTSHDFNDLTNWYITRWSRHNNLSKLNKNSFGQ